MNIDSLLTFLVSSPGSESGGTAVHPGTESSAILSLGLILFMMLAMGAFIFYLRYRAMHPLDQHDPLEEKRQEEAKKRAVSRQQKKAEPEPLQPWERPADWWKEDE